MEILLGLLQLILQTNKKEATQLKNIKRKTPSFLVWIKVMIHT